jgi:hypothetical protein
MSKVKEKRNRLAGKPYSCGAVEYKAYDKKKIIVVKILLRCKSEKIF